MKNTFHRRVPRPVRRPAALGGAVALIVLTFSGWVAAAQAPPSPPLLEKALAGPMAGVEEIIFAARRMASDGHWYANFSYYGPDANRKAYMEGGRLCRYNLKTGKTTLLIDDPRGGVRDPQVHYDGKKILFSYRKGGTDNYHLYEINADGAGLVQLTDGVYDDFEPTYLPDGDLVFVSSRCKRWVSCWLTQVAIMHRSGPDGRNIRCISANIEQDNTPWVMPDGRLLYMRWEYVDRSQVDYHHLWVANPDGTAAMAYFGNMHPATVMLDAKPIPGTDRVVAIFSPGHGVREHAGDVTIVDPDSGPDARPMARRVSRKTVFRDPYPFSEDCFLVAGPEGILLMDGQGRTQVLVPKTDALDLHEPRPLAPRPRERVIPPRTDPRQATGRLLLADVTVGRNMAGVKPGEITKLLVLEVLPTPVHYSGGMEPISLGGTFLLERILGTVPVEPDGSAYFEVPALRPVFFIAMDAHDNAIKRMHSFTNVQPGETTGCTGCHEQRERAMAPTGSLLALRRPPSPIQPMADVPEVFDFPRDIQPILDKHCVTCHSPDKRDGGVILSGDRGPLYSHGYYTILSRGLVADGRNLAVGSRPPRSVGAAASRLTKMLDGSHYGAKLSDHERRMIGYWIESGAVYPGTYAAAGTGMIGGYVENTVQRIDVGWPSVVAAAEATQRRCAGCHDAKAPLPKSPSDDMREVPWEQRRLRLTRHLAYNLTRPGKSQLLLGPLAVAAGGYGTCRAKAAPAGSGEKAPEVFADTRDPDYRKMLAAIIDVKKWLDETKRFDMPGYRPSMPYVREMKRYGILPERLGPDDPVDAYATDQAYWRSFWYEPRTP
jgi:hypothetical protein